MNKNINTELLSAIVDTILARQLTSVQDSALALKLTFAYDKLKDNPTNSNLEIFMVALSIVVTDSNFE
jgi:hypothetical protein